MANMIEEYLTTLQSLLPVSKWQRARILREIEDHLLESWDHEQEHGAAPEEAFRRVLTRFGEPAVIARAFAEQDALRKARDIRQYLFVSLVLCLILMCYTLFRYPTIGGSIPASVGCSLFCAIVLYIYGWIGLRATRLARATTLPVLRQKMRLSWLNVAIWGGVSLLSNVAEILLWTIGATIFPGQNLLTIDHMLNSIAVMTPFIAWLIFTLIGSGSIVVQTRRISTGSVVGLWSGLAMALGIALTSLLVSYVLMGFSLHTSWAHDLTCSGSTDLAACELGDTLGGIANMLLVLPLLGAGVGTIGGLLFRIGRRHTTPLAMQLSGGGITLQEEQEQECVPLFLLIFLPVLLLIAYGTHIL